MSRRGETAALHRERILSAAEALFAQKGFDATTIDDISKACGYSRRTIYACYQNKDDLRLHAAQRGLIALRDDLKAAAALEGGFLARYRAICAAMTRYRRDFPCSARTVDAASVPRLQSDELPPAARRILALGEEINALLTGWIEAGQREGVVRADVAPALSVMVLQAGLSALLALNESKGAYIEKSHALDEGAFLEYGFNQLAAALLVNPS